MIKHVNHHIVAPNLMHEKSNEKKIISKIELLDLNNFILERPIVNKKKLSAFYYTDDIMSFYDCSINQVPVLIARGIIPKPFKHTSRSSRRWLKSDIDKRLKLQKLNDELVREIVRDEVRKFLKEDL